MKRLYWLLPILLIWVSFLRSEDRLKDEIKVSDLPELDQLKLQNTLLKMNNIAKDMQILQGQFDQINKTELPNLIDSIRVNAKLSKEEWDFDGNTLSFKRRAKVK